MLIYVVPFTLFFMVALRALHANFSRLDAPAVGHYVTTILVLSLGFVVLIGGQYLAMWLGGKLINPFPTSPVVPLSTIIGIQFVPLLAAVAVISTFTWRRTGMSLPGSLICGLLVDLVHRGRNGDASCGLIPRPARRCPPCQAETD
jgi:hypothetical protein